MRKSLKSGKLKAEAQDPKEKATEELRCEIGKKIQEIRKAAGLTALKVSEELNISREALTQIETGRNNVNATMLWKLANLFGCEVSAFFPPVTKDYAYTTIDAAKVKKINERAAEWAKTIFTKKENHER